MWRLELGLLMLLALSQRPAHSHHQLSDAALHALTMIDRVVTKTELIAAFGAQDTATALVALAADPSTDVGVRLRAIRALPLFCSSPCSGTSIHTTLLALLSGPSTGGPSVLLKRAALEALGAAKSGDLGDVSSIAAFLNHSSRDLRAAAASSLRVLCNTQALTPLRSRYQIEPFEQVRLAISEALRDLPNCAQ